MVMKIRQEGVDYLDSNAMKFSIWLKWLPTRQYVKIEDYKYIR